MMRRRAVTMFALPALAAGPAPAQEGPQPPGSPPPGPMHFAAVLQALDLTPQQTSQVDPLLKACHDEAESGRKAFEAARHALGDQIRADAFDDMAIRARAAAVAALEADRAVADAALLRDVRAVLTQNQRDEFDRRLQPPPPQVIRGGRAGEWRPQESR